MISSNDSLVMLEVVDLLSQKLNQYRAFVTYMLYRMIYLLLTLKSIKTN